MSDEAIDGQLKKGSDLRVFTCLAPRAQRCFCEIAHVLTPSDIAMLMCDRVRTDP
jgi:hypothetical protein